VNDPEHHLLLTGTRQLFLALAEETHEEGWPTLTKNQIMGIAAVVFDEIVENPDWLLDRAELGDDSALRVAVSAALSSLLQHSRDPRLSSDTAAAAILAAVNACAMRFELLRELPPGGADSGKVAIRAAIDAILESAFGDHVSVQEKWLRARNTTLVTALEVALDRLARIGAEQKHIEVLRREIGGLIDGRLSMSEMGERLELLLKAA
jgi:hypothetical protein